MSGAIELAAYYFELSNQGDLAEIRKLFTDSSTYSSATTGIYLGAENIMAMQIAFFSNYRSLQWQIVSSHEVKPGIVLIDFRFIGTTMEGEVITREGLETVVVYMNKIQHIEVKNKV